MQDYDDRYVPGKKPFDNYGVHRLSQLPTSLKKAHDSTIDTLEQQIMVRFHSL